MKIDTLMLIDDDKIDQLLHKRIVDRSNLFENVLSYQYAGEALEYLATEKIPVPDMIFLDINMPRMDGMEFLEAVSELPSSVQKPDIVMLTTSLDPKDKDRVSEFDFVRGYLSKPLSQDSLQTVAQLVNQSR